MTSHSDQELDRRFAEYEALALDYGIRWWTRDSGVEAILRRRPDILRKLEALAVAGQVIETSDVYRDPWSTWTAMRMRVHRDVLQGLLSRYSTTVRSPVAVFLLGLPGSGKSSVLRPIAEGYLRDRNTGSPLIRDADEIRGRLPEYARGLGTQVVQEEVVDVTYGEFAARIPWDRNLLIDLVGDPQYLAGEIRHFAAQGLGIAVLCAEVPLEVAERRAKERALATGRLVSLEYLRACRDRPRRALDQALREGAPIDHWAVIDTNTGQEPARVIDGEGPFGAPGAKVVYSP